MKQASRKVTERDMKEFFVYAESATLDDLRNKATENIENARAPNNDILRKIPSMGKNQIIQVMTNFYFKGIGLGVK